MGAGHRPGPPWSYYWSGVGVSGTPLFAGLVLVVLLVLCTSKDL